MLVGFSVVLGVLARKISLDRLFKTFAAACAVLLALRRWSKKHDTIKNISGSNAETSQ